jgi:DNA-binding MarR family transcriptional regulator
MTKFGSWQVRAGNQLMDVDEFQNGLPAFRSSEEILSHPRFSFARNEFVKAILALHEHKPFLNRLLLEASRTVLAAVIMCLYAVYDEADPETWPTLSLVMQAMAVYGLASSRRVQDLVSGLVKAGYLERRPLPQDRRVRILTPTGKMIAQDQDFLVSHYLPLEILFPEPGYARIMNRDVAFQLKHRLVSRDLFALSAQIMASNPIMMLFMSRDAGVMILLKMIQMAAGSTGARRASFSYSEIGDRFGVSRTHVRNLLTDAEGMELVRLTKAGGRFVEVTPKLMQAFDRFVADSMSGFDLRYELALRERT